MILHTQRKICVLSNRYFCLNKSKLACVKEQQALDDFECNLLFVSIDTLKLQSHQVKSDFKIQVVFRSFYKLRRHKHFLNYEPAGIISRYIPLRLSSCPPALMCQPDVFASKVWTHNTSLHLVYRVM